MLSSAGLTFAGRDATSFMKNLESNWSEGPLEVEKSEKSPSPKLFALRSSWVKLGCCCWPKFDSPNSLLSYDGSSLLLELKPSFVNCWLLWLALPVLFVPTSSPKPTGFALSAKGCGEGEWLGFI